MNKEFIISGIFVYECEEFKNAKYKSLEEFLEEIMDIKIYNKEKIIEYVNLLDCCIEDWFSNEKEIEEFKENDNFIMFYGNDYHYTLADKDINKTIIEFIKNNNSLRKTFKELIINGEKVI